MGVCESFSVSSSYTIFYTVLQLTTFLYTSKDIIKTLKIHSKFYSFLFLISYFYPNYDYVDKSIYDIFLDPYP